MSATELPNVEMTLEYPYTRTTGPVIGPFLTGLRDGRIGFRDFAVGEPAQHIEGTLPTVDAGNLALLITESGVGPGKGGTCRDGADDAGGRPCPAASPT